MLVELLQEVLLRESVSVDDIGDVMDNHKRVIINYHSKGEDVATGARVIEVYAYGLTKAGNPVIRAFQPFGDTTSRVPSWKFFRLDRISAWKETNQRFSRPASEFYRGLGEFNPNDDLTMSTVYKITTFDDNQQQTNTSNGNTNPKLKPELFKTDTERNMERFKQQIENPIKLSDIKTKDAFKDINKPKMDTGPKLKHKQNTGEPNQLKNMNVRNNHALNNIETNNEIEDLKNRLGDTSNRIPIDVFNRRLANKNDLYHTDTERGIENLKKQIENPEKIDLDKIPKK